ncbi:hypothetical protein [Streptomyces sp. NPDC051183]|uniref:hypothetical protein n=1 Tax=unclassified Streptomyces TaxID=2593676 RepID=UPI00341A12FD
MPCWRAGQGHLPLERALGLPGGQGFLGAFGVDLAGLPVADPVAGAGRSPG